MPAPFWNGQYSEGMHNLEENGAVPTWKRDNFTSQELQIIAAKVESCSTLSELLSLLRSDLSTANCAYEGPKQTGREVADYLEKLFSGEKLTHAELRQKTLHLGLGILGKVSLLALTEKLTKEAPSLDRTTDNDLGSSSTWAAPIHASRPKGISSEDWLKMQNAVTAKRPRIKTKEELEALLPKNFPVTWGAQVPEDIREPENLNHWNAWTRINAETSVESSTITSMPPERDSSRKKLADTLVSTRREPVPLATVQTEQNQVDIFTVPNIDTPYTTTVPAKEQIPEIVQGQKRLSSFEKPIFAQNTISDLCSLLLSKEYKNKPYGVGKDAITGDVLAERIVNTVWSAKVGAKIDTTTFIPEPAIAEKLESILRNSLTWTESVSSEGTIIFEKIKDSKLSTDTQKSVDRVFAAVTEQTEPRVRQQIKEWVTTNRENTKLGARVPFWMSLTAALGLGVSTYSHNTLEKNLLVPTPVSTSSISEGVTTVSSQGEETKNPSSYIIPTKQQNTQEENSPATTTDNPEVPDITEQKTSEDEVSVPDITEQKTPESNILEPNITEQKNTQIKTIERPTSFVSKQALEAYLFKTGKLSAFRRLLKYSDGQEDASNKQRSYWFENILLHKKTEILRSQNPNAIPSLTLNLDYTNYIQQEVGFNRNGVNQILVGELINKRNALEKWHTNYITPLVNNDILKVCSPDEKENLENTNLSLGEYYTEVIFLAEKYNLGDVSKIGIHSLTPMELTAVQNFTLSNTTTTETYTQKTYTPELNVSENGSSRTTWLKSAFENAVNSVSVDMTDEQKREWILGPVQHVINEYLKDRDRTKTEYTKDELRYMYGLFANLKIKITEIEDNKGSVFSILPNFVEEQINDTDRIDKIIKEIENAIASTD